MILRLAYPKFWQKKNSIIAKMLWLPSLLYYLLGLIRKLYIRPIALPYAKVICVGNVTVGGTGKTQVVKWLIKFYQSHQVKLVVISKSYKAKLKGATLVTPCSVAEVVGDEALMLSSFTNVIATSNLCYAIPLVHQLKPDIVILDDGLQNPTIVKDIILLVVDGYRMFGNECLLPAGPLRDYPQRVIASASAIIVVGSSEVNNIAVSDIKQFNHHYKPLFTSDIIITKDINKEEKYFAFSGIGNPQRFLAVLKLFGISVIGFYNFPDHHIYSNQDVEYLTKQAKQFNAKLITTSKDYVKIANKLEVTECKVELNIQDSPLLEKLLYENTFKKN